MSNLLREMAVSAFPQDPDLPAGQRVADVAMDMWPSEQLSKTGAGLFTYCGIGSRLNGRFPSPHAVSGIKHFCGPLKILSWRLHFHSRSSEMQGFRSYYYWYLSRKEVGWYHSQMGWWLPSGNRPLGNWLSLCLSGYGLVEECVLLSWTAQRRRHLNLGF